MNDRTLWRYLFGSMCALWLLVACGTPDTGSSAGPAPSPAPSNIAMEPTDITPSEAAPPMNNTPDGSKAAAIEGTTWQLVDYGPADAAVAALPGPPVTLTFEADGKLGGSAGCNSYFATYILDAQSFSATGIGSTEMACLDDQRMQQERDYLAALQSATALDRVGDTLTIAYAGGQLRFTLIEPEPAVSLEGTPWRLDAFLNGELARSTLTDTTITAEFNDGTVTGVAGCNQYSAPYTRTAETLVVNEIVTTRMACDAAIMAQEREFLNALRAVSSMNITGSRLELVHPAGSLVFLANDQDHNESRSQ